MRPRSDEIISNVSVAEIGQERQELGSISVLASDLI
jgi:hypothetical protein